MNNEMIEKMVHRIRGTFPAQTISFNVVIDTWQQDDYLQQVSTDEARKAMPLIERHGKFPSLPEMRDFIRQANYVPKPKVQCELCEGEGWDSGLRLTRNQTTPTSVSDWWIVCDQPYTQTWKGHTYSAVKRCKCGN